MKTKTIKIYKFKELKKDIQEKVLDNFREQEEFYFLEDMLKEELEYYLKKNKIKQVRDLKIRYSLSSCQGDGFSFIGLFNWKKYLIKIELGSLSNLYCHSNTTDIYIEDEKGEDVEGEIYGEFNKIYQDICFELEKFGYALIDDTLSDENIKENIEMNDYTFRENGEIEFI